MKLFKVFLSLAFAALVHFTLSAQSGSILGTWQLVKQGSCLDESPTADQEESLENLRSQMHSRTPATAQVVSFKKNSTGNESSRILNTDKTSNPKKFYYKFNGKMLLILDKKSQTISDSYIVDKFTADSLIVSNSARPCETRIFIKIREEKAN
jgi:hypothetical protein